MEVKEKVITYLGKEVNALELILENSAVLTVRDIEVQGPCIVYQTLNGEKYKANVDLSETHPLLKQQQYYFDFH